MALICRVLLAILFHLLVRGLKGQELTAEVLSVKLPRTMRSTSSIYDGKDSIYIIGGTNSREILKLSLSEGSLTQVALLPSARYAGSSVIDDKNENIYYFGGEIENVGTGEIYKLNLLTNSVTLVGNLAFQSVFSAGVKYTDQSSSKVFLIGGPWTNNVIQCWDMDLNSNCPYKTIDTALWFTSAVSYGNEAFVFADANFTDGGDSVYRVNLNTFETSFEERILPDLYRPPAAVLVGSNAYIIGGWNNQTNFPTNSIIQVDLVSLKVIDLPVSNFIPTATIFSEASAVYVEKLNRIYVIGGVSNPHGSHDEIWSIDLPHISPTTTTEQISCFDKPDGFYPHPQDCSLFIGCRDSALDVFKCTEPLLFDPIEAKCNYPDLVQCLVQ